MGKEKGRIRELFLDLVFDIVGGFLQAIGLHCFIDSINIAPGGATGMAILINRLTGLPLGSLTFLINIPLLAAAWCPGGSQPGGCVYAGLHHRRRRYRRKAPSKIPSPYADGNGGHGHGYGYYFVVHGGIPKH